MVLLQLNWRRGFKGLFSKGFISSYSISLGPLNPFRITYSIGNDPYFIYPHSTSRRYAYFALSP